MTIGPRKRCKTGRSAGHGRRSAGRPWRLRFRISKLVQCAALRPRALPTLALVAAAAGVLACGQRAPGRRPPVARIDGASLSAGYGTLVTLDGSKSSDPDGDPLTYRWRVLGAPEVSKTVKHADRPRFTFRTAPARARFALRPSFGPVPIPRGGEGALEVELVVSDGARRDRAVARVRSAAVTGGWPRVESGLDLTVSCGKAEDTPARWELVETPAASRAVVLEPDRCLARVRADLTGRYVLAETTSGKRIPFWYGDWVGHEECARPECHPNEAATWLGTKHASVFARGLEGGLGADYGPECWGCHTLGQDTGGRSIGFRRAAEALDWTPPASPAPGAWGRVPARVKLWANVQCEQCHGPGRFWTGLTANVCAQCHDAPPRYHLVADWRRSRMSVPPTGATAARADCATCHSAHGGIARLDGGTAARPKEEPEAQGITCPVCHDPHEVRFPVQLRRFGDVTLGGRTAAAGKSAVCFACHGAWQGPADAPDGRAPHAPQGFMLLTPAGEAPAPHAAVPDLCVGCHMKRPPVAPTSRPARAGEASRGAMGGHTFSLRGSGETLDAACRQCHEDVRGLAVGGGLSARRLAEDTERLRARVQAAAASLGVRGCSGSPAADLVPREGLLVLVDALGRTLEDCAHVPVALPPDPAAASLLRAATLAAVLEKDRSRGAHNLPLAARLVAEGLALLPGSGSQSPPP